MTNNSNSYQEEYERIIQAKEKVVRFLSGENSDVCLDQEPSRRLCIGIITPLKTSETQFADDKKKWILKRRPDSIGFESRVIPQGNQVTLKLKINFSIYYRVFPTYQEQIFNRNINTAINNNNTKIHFRQKFHKLDVEVDDLKLTFNIPEKKVVEEIDSNEITLKINESLDHIANEVIKNNDCWTAGDREPSIYLHNLNSQEEYSASIPTGDKEKPIWKTKFSIKVWPAENEQWRISFLLTNVTENDSAKYQTSLFNVKVKAFLENGRFTYVPFHAAALDYRYSTVSWGKGINCVLKVSDDGISAETISTPEFEQPKTVSRENLNKSCLFSRLSSNSYLEAFNEIGAWLNTYLQEWKNENKHFKEDLSIDSREKSVIEYENEVNRFFKGVDAIKRDKRLEKSFLLMNETFSKGKYQGWKLFQLVFIITQLPSLLAREIPEEQYLNELKIVDVLWFPTGGGKTEAYFGVILTALFFDRLRGKSGGVTAWLRYPLRMLSIQQLQRLVDVIAKADDIRKVSKIEELIKGDPFTVGYYVGSVNTPNELTVLPLFKSRYGQRDPITVWKENIAHTSDINELKILVLQRCPYCESSDIKVEADEDTVRIKHICNNCGKEAPIYISDSEIYRYAPSVIVGTVDRLARVGQTSLFSHLYGKFDQKCPEHGYIHYGKCIEHTCKVRPTLYEKVTPIYDPSPALLLQDELHLLKESLGTYDSHYETFLDLLAENSGKGLPSKRLAATATIEGYKDHVSELYGKDSIRFPVKGRGEFDSAYSELSPNNTKARLYMGFMPTGSSPEETVSLIQQALKGHSLSVSGSGQWSENIISNYDLSLVYVNEKNTAGNFGSNIDNQNIAVLTGDKGLGEVRAVIGKVESDENRDFKDRLKGIVATSVISHGVDLSRLNFMTFCGMPNHASDYIQASSRVGRSHFGVVFTVFRPTNNRERNIYQRFYEYHERLYQLVQPIPINRFSESSIGRTLSGILSSCILNILAYRIGRQLDRADDYLTAKREGLFSEQDLITLVKKAYKIDEIYLSGSLVDFFSKLINKLIGVQKRMIESGERYSTYQRMIPPPVSSLREVREQIEFSVNRLWNHDTYVKVANVKKSNNL